MFIVNSSGLSFCGFTGMVRYACTRKLNSVSAEWLALITVSLPSPQAGCFYPDFSGIKAPSPCHHPTVPRRVAGGMGQACDRNYAGTWHSTNPLPAVLELQRSSSSPVPAQAAPGRGHKPLQGCWALSEKGTGLLCHQGGFHLHLWHFLSCLHSNVVPAARRWPQQQLLLLCPSTLVLASPARVKADPFGI